MGVPERKGFGRYVKGSLVTKGKRLQRGRQKKIVLRKNAAADAIGGDKIFMTLSPGRVILGGRGSTLVQSSECFGQSFFRSRGGSYSSSIGFGGQ